MPYDCLYVSPVARYSPKAEGVIQNLKTPDPLGIFVYPVNNNLTNVNRAMKQIEMGPSIKYVTLQGGGGLRKCDSLWQGEGVKIVWRHTFNFFTIRNFMFYFIFYHT